MRRIWFVLPLLVSLSACYNDRGPGPESESGQAPAGGVRVAGPIYSYADVVQAVAPAVVTIRASKRVRAAQQFPFFDNPLFREFFGGGSQSAPSGTVVEEALGSGVIVQPDGHILTNDHVIDGAQEIKVSLTNLQTYSAKVVGSDAASDLAVLKIGASGLPVLRLGDSDKARIGDVVLALGNPFGVGESVTSGIISAKGRTTDVLGSGSFEDFLQTDAAINKGNSGGALVNTQGELIGINSQILSPNGGGSVGIGFAIPSNMARNVMDQLIKSGKVERGMLGVSVQSVNSDIAASLGLKEVSGVLVNSVNPGGPAQQAGLKQGDVILQLDGKDVTAPNDLRNEIAAKSPGSEVTLTVWRNGGTQQIRVRLGTLTGQAAAQNQSAGGGGANSPLGIATEPLTPDLAARLGLNRMTKGVAIDSVDPNGPAAQAGLQAGDVIQQVGQQPVNSPGELQSALNKSAGRPPLLLIDRGGHQIFVPVPSS